MNDAERDVPGGGEGVACEGGISRVVFDEQDANGRGHRFLVDSEGAVAGEDFRHALLVGE